METPERGGEGNTGEGGVKTPGARGNTNGASRPDLCGRRVAAP